MKRTKLSANQKAVKNSLIKAIERGDKIIVLTGGPGVGKTELLSRLVKKYPHANIAAYTHQAARVLGKKLGKKFPVRTVADCTRYPVFRSPLPELDQWVEHNGTVLEEKRDNKGKVIDRVLKRKKPPEVVLKEWPGDWWHSVPVVDGVNKHKVYAQLDINPFDYCSHWLPKDREFSLIFIDEASQMSAEEMLKFVVTSHHQIVLIGDPRQTQPISEDGEGSLVSSLQYAIANYHAEHLHETFRFDPDSRLPEFIEKSFRKGRVYTGMREPLAIELAELGVESYAVLCWRNDTCDLWNERIREALGYPNNELAVGDRILSEENRQILQPHLNDGLFIVPKNSRWRVMEAWINDEGNQMCRLQEDIPELKPEDREELLTAVSMREFKDQWVGLHCRFAYATTVHKAQGGEWESVYIDCADIAVIYAFNKVSEFDKQCWAYTAVSRAKSDVRMVNRIRRFQ